MLQGSLQKEPHPRAYVNQNKAQLMAWDTYAWKQLLNKLDGACTVRVRHGAAQG